MLATTGAVFDNPAKKMRVDAAQRAGAIEAYITTGSAGGLSRRPNDPGRIAAGMQRPTASADGGAPSEFQLQILDSKQSECCRRCTVAPARVRKVAPPQLDSVRDLLKKVSASSHAELYSVLRGHVYVGAVDNSRHLLQHQTQLYMVDTTAVWYVAHLCRCVPQRPRLLPLTCSRCVCACGALYVCPLGTAMSCSIKKHCDGLRKWKDGLI